MKWLMLCGAILLGGVVLGVMLCALGHAAKDGDRKLREYNEARGIFYRDENDA